MRQVKIRPSSKVIVKFLEVMLKHRMFLVIRESQNQDLELLIFFFYFFYFFFFYFFFVIGYIGEFEVVDDHRGNKIVVNLIGRVNKCGVISPRFDVQLSDMEKWITNLLPSRQFGYLILTTSYGIMDHEEARKKHTGGKILGYVY